MSEPTTKPAPELTRLQIAPQKKSRGRRGPALLIVLIVCVIVALVAAFAFGIKDGSEILTLGRNPAPAAPAAPPVVAVPPKPGDAVLTVSGYMVPHKRIEISPKFIGTVTWLGVKKGDAVKKGDVIVRLEDDEYRARLQEAQGNVALAEANVANAEVNLKRQQQLLRDNIDSQRALDDARRARDAAIAEVTIAKGKLALVQTWLEWCTIRSPIDGTVLEKLTEEHELVMPQSFGSSHGPSTAVVALADLNDLQVEIDLNEADTPKVHLNQRCRVRPEAYLDKSYRGYVSEIAPEANRQKGTLQLKVQIEKPDHFLTPELSERVDFLAD